MQIFTAVLINPLDAKFVRNCVVQKAQDQKEKEESVMYFHVILNGLWIDGNNVLILVDHKD